MGKEKGEEPLYVIARIDFPGAECIIFVVRTPTRPVLKSAKDLFQKVVEGNIMKRMMLGVLALVLAGSLFADTLPPTPVDLKTELVPSLIPAVVKLSWTAPAGPWGYIVYRSEGDSLHFKAIARVNATVYYDNLYFPQKDQYYAVTSFVFGPDMQRLESPRSAVVRVPFGPSPATGQGIIAGTVLDDTTGKPIRSVAIRFYRMGPGVMTKVAPYAVTDSLGHYKALLDTGTYKIHAEPAPYMPPGPPAYLPEWYDNVAEMSAATSVILGQGKTVTADFGLSRFKVPARPTGVITGKVLDDATQKPIPGVFIRFFGKNIITPMMLPSVDPASSEVYQPSTVTDSLGFYQARLDTGVYLVRADAPMISTWVGGYRSEWFDNVTDPAKATPVHVSAGTISAEDFGLSKIVPPSAVMIEGTVTDTLGHPLSRATVAVMRTLQELDLTSSWTGAMSGPDDESVDVDAVGYCRGVLWKGLTDSLGHYRAKVLSGPSYIALASKWGYLPEYYDNKQNPTLADVIVADGNKTGIDFSLALNPMLNNSVSGRVQDSLGNGVPSRVVLIPVQPWGSSLRMVRFGHTSAQGTYTIGDVKRGSYFVLAVPFGGYAPAFYKAGAYGVMRWQKADTVLVSGDLAGIDIGVVKIKSVGLATLTGRVVASNGPSLQGVRVFATSPAGEVLGFGLTDVNGQYAIGGVMAGSVDIAADRDGYAFSQRSIALPAGQYSVRVGDIGLTSVVTGVQEKSIFPSAYQLHANYPNPFNPSTTIVYDMPVAGLATIRVYNMLGQEITTLVNGLVPAGRNAVVWNGTDRAGKGVASGVYLYRFGAMNPGGKMAFTQVRKMLLMK
jgi:hypothetical protein